MKTVRFVSNILFYASRVGASFFLLTTFYALIVVLLFANSHSSAIPMRVDDGGFQIFFPFTHKPFLLGDYTASYLVPYLITFGFYGLFLWLLSGVFHAFKQPKLFTRKGVNQLSRFYIANLTVPFLFVLLLVLFQGEFSDIVRIIFLHIILGVFAFFMAAIFRQGLILQEEQDLTF